MKRNAKKKTSIGQLQTRPKKMVLVAGADATPTLSTSKASRAAVLQNGSRLQEDGRRRDLVLAYLQTRVLPASISGVSVFRSHSGLRFTQESEVSLGWHMALLGWLHEYPVFGRP
jgi:hypothetical protein